MGHYKSEGQHIWNSRPKSHRRSDTVIKGEVCDILAESPNVNCSNIDVSVNSGVVTLRGTIQEPLEKQQVEDLVEYVSGVNEVQNELKVERAKIKRKKRRLSNNQDARLKHEQ